MSIISIILRDFDKNSYFCYNTPQLKGCFYMNFGGKVTFFAKMALIAGGLRFCLNTVHAEGTIINEVKTQKSYEQISEQAFEESIDAYDNYVENIAAVMAEYTDVGNPISVLATYLEMLNSKDITFGSLSQEENIVDIRGYWGMNVVIGEGVCRHHADNLSRVLNALGFDSALVLGEAFMGDDPTNNPNHAVVYVKNGKDVILLDPTNQTIFLMGDKYYESLDGSIKFIPSLSCDQIYGFASDNYPAYFTHKDMSESRDLYIELFNLYKEIAHEQDALIRNRCAELLREDQKIIFKELIEYRALYNAVADRLGMDATENDVLDAVLEHYDVWDYIESEYDKLVEDESVMTK